MNTPAIPDLRDHFGATVRFHHPLLDLNAVKSALNLETYQATALIEEGKLRWAWNFSTSKRRREIRVLAHSVIAYQKRAELPKLNEDEEFNAVCDLVIPGSLIRVGIVGSYRACMLARRLAVNVQTVNTLIRRGELKLLKMPHEVCGPNASPEIEATSIAAMLKRRRIA